MSIRTSILISCLAIIVMSGCKEKGCTDPYAINYDVTANEDDGTCMYCNTDSSEVNSMVRKVKDNFSSSIHFTDTVAFFHFSQVTKTPSGELCGDGESNLYLKVIGNVPESMNMHFQVTTFSGPLFISWQESIFIPAYGTTDIGIINTQNTEPYLDILLVDSIQVQIVGLISYF